MKNLFKSIICITIFFGLLSLFGCKSTEPSQSDTLLVGQISLDAKGFQDHPYITEARGVKINGNKQSNITIAFRNKESQKTYAATTDKLGVFYLLNPQPGSYIIEKLTFKSDTDLGWESISVSGVSLPLTQQLATGKVYNLGLLHWNAWVDAKKEQSESNVIQTLKDVNEGLATLSQENSFDKLKGSFAEKLPKSPWLQKEWVNMEMSPLSQPASVKFKYSSN